MVDLVKRIEAAGRMLESGFGLRYFLSGDYRARTHARWKEMAHLSVVFEVGRCLMALSALGFVLRFLVQLLWPVSVP